LGVTQQANKTVKVYGSGYSLPMLATLLSPHILTPSESPKCGKSEKTLDKIAAKNHSVPIRRLDSSCLVVYNKIVSQMKFKPYSYYLQISVLN